MKQNRRLALIIVLFVLVAAVAGSAIFAEYRYRLIAMNQMGLFASALYFYQSEHKQLPPDIETLRAMETTGDASYRMPRSRWELFSYTGPSVRYLPVKKVNQNYRYVIAVQPPTGPDNIIRYLVLGDMSVHAATEDELKLILARDDRHRIEAGEQRLWRAEMERR